jgi:hypothetical protein
MSERASMLETGVEKEIGIIVECDILACFKVVALNDSEFDDGRGIDGSTVTVGLHSRTTGSSSLRLLQNGHLVPEAAVAASNTVNAGDRVARRVGGNCRRSSHCIGVVYEGL